MTLTELLDYKTQTRNSTHEAYDRLNGLSNKKFGRAEKVEKLGKDSLGRVDDIFSVSRRQVAEEGVFKGDDCYCVVDSDFTVENPMTREPTRKYSRDEVDRQESSCLHGRTEMSTVIPVFPPTQNNSSFPRVGRNIKLKSMCSYVI